MRNYADNTRVVDYLFQEFSMIYGASWDKKLSTNEKEATERKRWARVVGKMRKEQLRRALNAIESTPSPHPTFPPQPLVFKDLGYSHHDKAFNGECCYKMDDEKQCRSTINVQSRMENSVKKMYCNEHLHEITTLEDAKKTEKRDIKLREIGVDPEDIFTIMIAKKLPNLAGKSAKRLSKYSDHQLVQALELIESDHCKKDK